MSSSIHSSPIGSTLINGEPTDVIAVSDRGFCYGDGLFETVLVVGKALPFKTLHWQRLQHGCERLGLNLDLTLLERSVDRLLQGGLAVNDNDRSMPMGVLKVILTRGTGPRGYRPGSDVSPTLVVQLVEKKQVPVQNNGIQVVLCQHRLGLNPALAGIKHLNRLDNVLASMEVNPACYREGLLFDINDNLIEATARNVFLCKGGKLVTPELDQCGVAGIMRQLIMEKYASGLSLQVEERKVTRAELFDAEEVFLSNSIEGIWPVAGIGSDAIASGSVANQLQARWWQDVKALAGDD